MVSDHFRRQLHQEAEQWWAEGLIDDTQYAQLSDRYQFHRLETASRSRFIMILIGLGSILLGLGIITFVAANWQAWSRELKVTLLLSLFILVNTAGFYLWRHPTVQFEGTGSGQQRLGQGLLLLGALVLGANMALMDQMFHISGSPYALLLLWGVGVLAMAYSLRLTFLGGLAILLVGLGYWQGQAELFAPGELTWLRLAVQHMPVLAGLMFIPLAYWCRSQALFGLAAIAVISSLTINPWRTHWISTGVAAAIACALPPALLWGYDDTLWSILFQRRLHRSEVTARPFLPIARSLALLFLIFLFYSLSFHWVWEPEAIQPSPPNSLLSWAPFLDVVILSGFAVWEWLNLLRQTRNPGSVDLTTSVMGCFIAIAALIPFWHLSMGPIPTLGVVIFNVLLFLLAGGLIREGLALGERRTFWVGIVLLTLQILSRLLEYDTDLLLKSIVFLLCGAGVITVGLWFERYVRTLSDRPSANTRLSEEDSP